jgi:hypothetical protein
VGPAIAVATAFFAIAVSMISIFLPFAFIGFLVWITYALLSGQPVPWNQIRDTGAGMVHYCLVLPAQMGIGFLRNGITWTGTAAEKAWHIGAIGLEVIFGALVCAMLMFVALWDHPEPWLEIALAGVVGGAIGAMVGTSHWRADKMNNPNPQRIA